MTGVKITNQVIRKFQIHLKNDEKSSLTVKKYVHDVEVFASFLNNREITKELLIEYKVNLQAKGYSPRSVNSVVASLNSLLHFLMLDDLKIKIVKIQQQVFCSEEKELSKEEYYSLCKVSATPRFQKIGLIIQTIAGTGIRISELQYITVDAVKKGEVPVCCKGKTRTIFIVKELQKKLLRFITEQEISSGCVFVSKNRKPLDRSNIWREMKKLCNAAGVNPQKVFPHNLRHLFARVYYNLEKDIAKLADILGHSSINTTRIYIVSTGSEHRTQMENMRLIL